MSGELLGSIRDSKVLRCANAASGRSEMALVWRFKLKQTDTMNFRGAIQSALVLATALLASVAANAADKDTSQYYELRVYTTQTESQQQRINEYWQRAGVPAYNRLGIRPIGVFTESQDSASNSIYVFIPYDSLEGFTALPGKLASDADYQALAAKFLNAVKTNAAYESLQTSLLVAFDGMKHINLPTDERPNLFELRTYISPSEGKGLNKIQMFENGEIELMKEVGLAPIFYGRTLSGPVMPSLVYMTCGVDEAAHKEHWSAFGEAPVWNQLKTDPQYKDNMTGMIRVILKRTPASQF